MDSNLNIRRKAGLKAPLSKRPINCVVAIISMILNLMWQEVCLIK